MVLHRHRVLMYFYGDDAGLSDPAMRKGHACPVCDCLRFFLACECSAARWRKFLELPCARFRGDFCFGMAGLRSGRTTPTASAEKELSIV